MIDHKKLIEKARLLDDMAMVYEVAVMPLFEEDYLKEFYDFYEIKNRTPKLIPSDEDFDGSLKNLSGEYRWEAIAEKTKELFGLPARVMIFGGAGNPVVREELEGCRGLAPFYFVFDLMFCEYGEYTLCFIAGSNN